MQKLVTIIVPFYKVEKYIAKCLDSIINQTYKNIEILCVGSKDETDPTMNIVKDYLKKDKRLKLFIQDGKGLGNTRNKGIENAKGYYLMYVDSDDYLELNFVELMVKTIEKTKSDIVMGGFDRVDEESGKIYSKEMINNENFSISKHNINKLAFLSPAAWGKIYKYDLIKDIRFSNEKDSVEDLMYFLNVILKVKKITFCNEILYHYLVRQTSSIINLSSNKVTIFKNELLDIKEKYENFDSEYNEFLALIAFIHLGISTASRIYGNKNQKMSLFLNETKEYLNNYFPFWRKIKLKTTAKISIKSIGIYVVKIMYLLNIEIIFFFLYNFMIKYLKIDIKW